MKIACPSEKKFGPKTSIFDRKFTLHRLRAAAARKQGGILGKLKQRVQLTEMELKKLKQPLPDYVRAF